ncbi:hypothetical protein [Streptomyces sp. NRRL S-646]|uniref:hypothetical protein n=1 Tax=Streptomyces sp. NRRL S-646 TaxID=1463917 RepID=UPI0013316C37|nr:hypothetical protein [Streptomyces sp. NRRL S-646]
MPPEQKRVGVCVVRVEAQPYGPLITVRVKPDLGQALTAKATTTDTEAAVTLVREFLQTFIADTPPR